MSIKLDSITLDKRSINNYEKLDKKLLATDLILMLLSVSPIKGNTKLQKQVFLAWKKIFSDVTVDLGYYPWKFGAYSRSVEDSMKFLIKRKFVKIKPGKGESLMYILTNSGKQHIQEKLYELGLDMRSLPDKKLDWDDWDTKGTLIHVYRNYPEYTAKTKVPSLKW
ncbi:hypothetical protein [Nitrosopumilus sp.]|uniref:hypothetical protein n=1 Tax=Nitrosopumilus sp. TaxID=2024843 RepID=UPI00292ECFF8|nr:hypothetical protein [Nitrosopumilus sp.]